MASFYMTIFAIALLVELTASSPMAQPKIKTEEESTDQDKVMSTAEDTSEMGPGSFTFRRHPIIEGRLVDEDGTKRIFILADTGKKGSPGREANLAFTRTFPMLPLLGMDRDLDGFSMRDERRSTDDVMPVGRRDIDMLRCMVGRVYRPCWKA